MPSKRQPEQASTRSNPSRNEMSDGFMEGFRAWYRDSYGHEVGDQPNLAARSRAFLRWYIESFLSDNYQIDPDEIEQYIVDRSNDLGADFVYPYNEDDQSGTLIVQAKFHSRRENESQEGIQNFSNLLERLKTQPERAHPDLQEILSEIDWSKPVLLVYLTSSRPTEGTASEMNRIKEAYESSNPLVTVEIITSVELNVLYRTQQTATTTSFNINHEIPVAAAMEFEGSYSVIVSATQIEQLYRKAKREALFQENIRNPLGSKLNTKIVETLKTEPQNFFFYNNGISALVTEAKPVIDESGAITAVAVRGIQVINGAQTVDSIAKAKLFLNNKKLPTTEFDKAHVYMRLIPRDIEGEKVEFTSKVIERNNSQNVVKQADFSAQDPLQRWLNKEFEKQYCPTNGKRVKYAYRRGNEGKSAEVIKVVPFGMRLISFLRHPGVIGNSVPKLFDGKKVVEEEGLPQKISWYDVVFRASNPKAEFLTNDEFSLRSAVWWYSFYCETERKKDYSKGKEPHLGSLGPILYTSRLLLEAKYQKEGARKILVHAASGNWIVKPNSLQYKLFSKLYSLSIRHLKTDLANRIDEVNQKNEDHVRLGLGKPALTFSIQGWRRDSKVFEQWRRGMSANPYLQTWEDNPQLDSLLN